MSYTNPEEVTAGVKLIEVINDGGKDGISVARIKWEQERKSRLAIRWNMSKGQEGKKKAMGMPSIGNNPLWFVLPRYSHADEATIIEIFKKKGLDEPEKYS
ncbi:MAG TPA: hypothetical protein VK808_04830 [Bacteroidia bacterium]|jgi:hypothetical protein|nr:hypothetical protein [Bacteroidia bacterium]